jgi:hypothetical protein
VFKQGGVTSSAESAGIVTRKANNINQMSSIVQIVPFLAHFSNLPCPTSSSAKKMANRGILVIWFSPTRPKTAPEASNGRD